MKLKHKAILFLFVLSLIFPVDTTAFYHIDKHAEEMQIDNATIGLQGDNNNRFQFYDNFSYPSENEFLIKKVPGFVFIKEIEINMPLKILSTNPISIENSIDRMLLANLKINHLLEQYAKLQKKAAVGVKESSGFSSERPSIKDNIEKEKQTILKEKLNWAQVTTTNMEDISPVPMFLKKGNADVKKNKEFSESINIPFGPDSKQADENLSVLSEIKLNSAQRTLNGSRDTSVPWIFEVLMDIVKYASSNRIEILLYLIFFMVFVRFVRLQVKR